MNSSHTIKIKKFNANQSEYRDDIVAVEEPLEIQITYGNKNKQIQKIISITMRTPGNDDELAAGFLFTEGILQNKNQIANYNFTDSEKNKILFTLCENEIPVLQNSERNFYTTSSCGVCGKSSIDSIRTVSAFKNIKDNIFLSRNLFYGLNEMQRKHQSVFEKTGGLHASTLFDIEGKFELLREDVGRHNALDKIIGYAFLNNLLPLSDKILLLSGRTSFELVQKAEMAGIKIIAAVGAPSSLAVQMAEESGITLIGFLQNDRFNIYTGEKRILD